eukprot:GFKZ01001433.1.p1 GENE.GFKZ01001433.1~~GFKZ01001433.1.p1  ORF type:complete len:612 (+),score=107.53 GFKZ01001433.1:170-2005(+)
MVAETEKAAGLKRRLTEHPKTEPDVKKKRRYDKKPERASRRDEKRELMARAKKTWEQLRPKATSKDKSVQLVKDLIELLRGRVVEFVFRHDGSRIVQWMLSDGNGRQQKEVLTELMDGWKRPLMEGELPFFVRLACDRYGHHLAFKVLRVSDKGNRSLLYDRYLKGNCSHMIRNSHGADVLDFAYQTILRTKPRAELVLELLYSKQKKLLDTVRAKINTEMDESSNDGKKNVRSSFERSLELIDDTFKDVVVESAGMTLNQLADKENLLRFEIVHAAMKEYLHVVMASYPKEKSQELAVSLAPVLIHLAHTKPGVYVAVTCIKILDAKHRKKVIRAVKTHVRKLLEDEYGHRLILALFEWVDDTRLVGKTISTEMFSNSAIAAVLAENESGAKASNRGGKKKADIKGKGGEKNEKAKDGEHDMQYMLTVCQHRYARMPLLSLLFGRDSRYFNPDVYGPVWSDLDVNKFGVTSKKDANIRRGELRMNFDKVMRDLMEDHVVTLIKSHWSAPIVLGALVCSETRESVMGGLKRVLQDDKIISEIVGNTCGRKTLGTILKVGGDAVGREFVDTCGIDLVRRLGKEAGCRGIAENIAAAVGSTEAANALKGAVER